MLNHKVVHVLHNIKVLDFYIAPNTIDLFFSSPRPDWNKSTGKDVRKRKLKSKSSSILKAIW